MVAPGRILARCSWPSDLRLIEKPSASQTGPLRCRALRSCAFRRGLFVAASRACPSGSSGSRPVRVSLRFRKEYRGDLFPQAEQDWKTSRMRTSRLPAAHLSGDSTQRISIRAWRTQDLRIIQRNGQRCPPIPGADFPSCRSAGASTTRLSILSPKRSTSDPGRGVAELRLPACEPWPHCAAGPEILLSAIPGLRQSPAG